MQNSDLYASAVLSALERNKFKPVTLQDIIGSESASQKKCLQIVRSHFPWTLHPEALLSYDQEECSFSISVLPDLCLKFSNCRSACGHIHMCKLYLLGICPPGEGCSGGHQFHSPKNADLLARNHLQDVDEKSLKLLFISLYRPMALRPKLCTFYTAGECRENEACPYLHICKYYIMSKDCSYGRDGCKRSHNILDGHNKRILRQYKVDIDVPFAELEELIRFWSLGQLPGPKEKDKICKFYGKGTCSKDSGCPYMHLCMYHLNGQCRYGAHKCTKSHDVFDRHNSVILENLGLGDKGDRREIERLLGGGDASSVPSREDHYEEHYRPTFGAAVGGRHFSRSMSSPLPAPRYHSRETRQPDAPRDFRPDTGSRPRQGRRSKSAAPPLKQRVRRPSSPEPARQQSRVPLFRRTPPFRASWQYRRKHGSWCQFPLSTCTRLENSLSNVAARYIRVDVIGWESKCFLDEISRYGESDYQDVKIKREETTPSQWCWYTGDSSASHGSWKKVADLVQLPNFDIIIEDSFEKYRDERGPTVFKFTYGKNEMTINYENWTAKMRHGTFDLRRRPIPVHCEV